MMDNETFKRIYNDAICSHDMDKIQNIMQNRVQELSQRVNIGRANDFDCCALAIIYKNLYDALDAAIKSDTKLKNLYQFLKRNTNTVAVVMPKEKEKK